MREVTPASIAVRRTARRITRTGVSDFIEKRSQPRMSGCKIWKPLSIQEGLLAGDVDDSHSPFANLLTQLVGADECIGGLGDRVLGVHDKPGQMLDAAALIPEALTVTVPKAMHSDN